MDFEQSRIEKLKRALYSRDEKRIPQEHRTPVHGEALDAPTPTQAWGPPPSFDITPEKMIAKKNNSFFEKFFGMALVFFALSLGVAAFIFFGGLNMISSNNVDIKVTGPSSVSSGEELLAEISIINGNRTNLENAALLIDYPEGTRSSTDDTTLLVHDRIEIGTIESGKSINQSLRGVFFGEVGLERSVVLRLEYGVKGSNSTFSKEKKYTVSIGSSPIIMNVEYPKDINSGQSVTFTINLTSNSSVVLPHTLLKIDYPYGFTYSSSSIKPLRGNALWDIGSLKGGDKKTLTVTGVLVGQNLEERTFTISVGTSSQGSVPDLETKLSVSSATVAIKKSFFDLAITSSGRTVTVAHPSHSVPVQISWQNTLPERIVNARIEATLSGNVFDRGSVRPADGGTYRSLDNTVLWDKNSTAPLSEMSPGDSGRVSFSFSSLVDPVLMRSVRNPYMDIDVKITGDRVSQDITPISSTARMTVRLLSSLNLTARSYRTAPGFTNTGPIPPVADKETTYVVNWTLTNTTNDVNGGIVSAILPAQVRWIGEVTPQNERVTYNSDTKQITWNVGSIAAGTGYTYSPKQISFKVALLPSVTNAGSAMPIVGAAQAVVFDTYASTTISVMSQPVTTLFSGSDYRQGDELIRN
jgi:hypothetical protein